MPRAFLLENGAFQCELGRAVPADLNGSGQVGMQPFIQGQGEEQHSNDAPASRAGAGGAVMPQEEQFQHGTLFASQDQPSDLQPVVTDTMRLLQSSANHRDRGEFEQAVDCLEQVLAIESDNGMIWGAAGHGYLMLNQPPRAFECYQNALACVSAPQDPHLWYGIGILYDHFGNDGLAADAFSAALKMDPQFEKSDEIYFRLGLAYKKVGQFDESRGCFEHVLNHLPENVSLSEVHTQLAEVHERLGSFGDACISCDKVLAFHPDDAPTLRHLGRLRHKQARQQRRITTNDSFINADELEQLAIDTLRRSLRLDSSVAESWYVLGRCFCTLPELYCKHAYQAYQRALALNANDARIWCSLGVLYYELNRSNDALAAFYRALLLQPDMSIVWYNLGAVHEALGHVPNALFYYRKVQEIYPEDTANSERIASLSGSTHNGNKPVKVLPREPLLTWVHVPPNDAVPS